MSKTYMVTVFMNFFYNNINSRITKNDRARSHIKQNIEVQNRIFMKANLQCLQRNKDISINKYLLGT